MLSVLTEMAWLNERRLRAYPRIFVAVFALCGLVWVALSDGVVDVKGKPLGYDFITFYSAADVAQSDGAADVYDLAAMRAAQLAIAPGTEQPYAWHYPPTFLLLVLPLAFLPYFAALAGGLAATLVAYLAVLKRIAPHPATLMLALAFPATFINLFHGQNGFLNAALLGAALLALERRPVIAGILLGLLSYKPHFGILVPLALIAGGYWRTILTAGATTLAFAGLSFAVFGAGAWIAFFDNMPFLRLVLENGNLPWFKMPTTFAALRLLGAPVGLAYGAQALVALGAAGAVVWAWRRTAHGTNRGPAPLAPRAAVLVAATLLVTPYAFDYDLTLIGLAVAWLSWDGVQRGFLPQDKPALLAGWLAPAVASPVAAAVGLQLGPVILAWLLFRGLRRIGAVQRLRENPQLVAGS
jgi:hypothetical protein